MAKRILVVDDNQLLVQALCEHLEQKGFDTLVANDGKEALGRLEKEKPDLIIMDIIMPVMGGVEATRVIRAKGDWKDIPVVAFTSRSNIGQWDELFDDYLVKPFDFDNLFRIIERLTNKPQNPVKAK